MIVGRWHVQLAAIWHWNLPLCIYVNLFLFLSFLSIPFYIFLEPGIDRLEWLTIPICPSLLTGVILKGLTLQKFVSDVCVYMFYVCEVIGFVD